MDEIFQLCDIVRETAYAVHRYHGNGYVEKVYENALVHRLRKLGINVKQQSLMNVHDEDGTILGEYLADVIVAERLVLELKVAKSLVDEHRAQLLNYLKGCRIEHGLLINFGSYKFQIEKYVLSNVRDNSGGPGVVYSGPKSL